MGCRRNLTRLTRSERQAFIDAVLQLKADGDYDKYVRMHAGAMGHGHGGPAFFPWHREFIRRFEAELQAIDESVALPYWDWTVGNLNSAGTESLIWRDDFMGGPGDSGSGFAVDTGPFADWGLRRNAFDIFSFPGGGGVIATRMEALEYRVFRGIEGPHGGAHLWVGGNAAQAPIAPQDPVFWLIHANVDRLWAEWTVNHQGSPGWVRYQPESGGPQGHNLNDTMWPWNGTRDPFGVLPWTTTPELVRPADLLDHRALGTYYDTLDVCLRPPIAVTGAGGGADLGGIRLPEEKGIIKDLVDRFPGSKPKDRLKDRKDMVEAVGIGVEDDKEIREGVEVQEPFIREGLRPDLVRAALGFEPDIASLRAELRRREGESLSPRRS